MSSQWVGVSRRDEVYRNPAGARTDEWVPRAAWSPAARRIQTMLTREEDELLTRTGPGTAMGALLRRYWIPVVQSGELEAGGRIQSGRLLCEAGGAARGER